MASNQSNFRYVFFGTPEFAEIILRKLIDAGLPPTALVCNPDRPVGRKKVITPPATKQCVTSQVSSVKEKIEILQPENLGEIRGSLHAFQPDFAVVAAYAKIIPKEVIGIFPRGMMGVHPSLLPKYRGSSPIQTAILNGEGETGVTLYLLDEKMDHGPIVSSIKYQASSNDTYETLLKKLAGLGGNLLLETIPKFMAGEIKPQPQNEAEATYTKKFAADNAFVAESDLDEAITGVSSEKAAAIERKIRALNPEPGVWTTRNGRRVKLLEAEIQTGKLMLKKIQEEGKKPRVIANNANQI